MSGLTIERIMADCGYRTVKAKEGKDGYRCVTLKKGNRTVTVDDELIEDIAALCRTVKAPAGSDSRIKAVS